MFKRRKPKLLSHKVRDYFWPKIGWVRFARYLYLRLKKQIGSTHSIALGMASGFGVSFIPLYGTHLLWIFLLCVALRGNFFAGVVSSFIGNPLTFPFMFALATVIGNILLGRAGIDSFVHFFHGTTEAPTVQLSLQALIGEFFYDVFIPAFLGGLLSCALVMMITYPINYLLVKEMQIAYKAQKKARIKLAARKMTKPKRTKESD